MIQRVLLSPEGTDQGMHLVSCFHTGQCPTIGPMAQYLEAQTDRRSSGAQMDDGR